MDGKSKNIVHYLNQEQIEFLKGHFKPVIFNNSSELFYEGQTPNLSFLLVKGEIVLSRHMKILEKVHENGVLGFCELMNEGITRVTATIKEGSIVLPLDKTTLKTLFVKADDFLKNFTGLQ